METDQSSQDKANPDQEQGTNNHNNQVIRSYECTFCKRGFSNAQALGGHMNIHRKDKAKLKHSSLSNEPLHHHHQQPLDTNMMISKNNINISPIGSHHPLMGSKYSEIRSSSTIKWPWSSLDRESSTDTSEKNKTHAEEIQQLSLFINKPSLKHHDHHHHQEDEEEEEEEAKQPINLHGNAEKGLCSSLELPSSDQLDLELRLGPEPQDSSPPTNTKRFF